MFTLPGDWSSPWIMLRLLQVVESPWEATEQGFVNAATGERVQLGMGGPIDGLAGVFAEGTDPTRAPFDDEFLESLISHHAVVQVSAEEGAEPLETVLAMIHAANAVVDAGALAVQVGSSGLAHPADAFQALVANVDAIQDESELYRALFPVLVRFHLPDGAPAMTVGQHALGRPDVVLEAPGSPDRAVGLLERAAFSSTLGEVEADNRSLPEPWRNPLGIVRI